MVCSAIKMYAFGPLPLRPSLQPGKSVQPERDWNLEGAYTGTVKAFPRMEGVDFLGLMLGLGVWDVELFSFFFFLRSKVIKKKKIVPS